MTPTVIDELRALNMGLSTHDARAAIRGADPSDPRTAVLQRMRDARNSASAAAVKKRDRKKRRNRRGGGAGGGGEQSGRTGGQGNGGGGRGASNAAGSH